MNPLAPYMLYVKIALVGALLSALALQTLRVSWKQESVARLEGEVLVFKERESAQRTAQAVRELHNAKLRERANEEYTAASSRAASGVVRVDAGAAIVAGRFPAYAGGGVKPAGCVGRGELEEWAAGVAGRNAERLTEILRGASERLGVGATGAARAAEGVGAAYRACRGFALGLD